MVLLFAYHSVLSTQGAQRSWQHLLKGRCGIVSLRDEKYARLPCRVAGVVPEGPRSEGKWAASDWLNHDQQHRTSRYMQYALAATQEALDDAGWQPTEPSSLESTGVCLGSGIGSFEEVYSTSVRFAEFGPKKVSPLFVPRLLINLAAGHISQKYGFQGPSHAVSTACTTGAHAIGDAARFIMAGDAEVMVAGGAESCVHPLAITGFARSNSLVTDSNEKPHNASRPFRRDRAGFVIAEGAGVMILEELEHARRRGAHIYGRIASYAATADAYHITKPRPDGHGAFRSMKKALASAQIPPLGVSYINAHATSTSLGDAAEAQAIGTLLLGSDGARRSEDVCVSSTKGAVGHLLGAAGAIEAIYSVLAIRDVRVIAIDFGERANWTVEHCAHDAQSR